MTECPECQAVSASGFTGDPRRCTCDDDFADIIRIYDRGRQELQRIYDSYFGDSEDDDAT